MSDENKARRADVQIRFEGSGRVVTMNKDWDTFTYVDNEEDSADDIRLKTHDRFGEWMREGIGDYVNDQAAAGTVIKTAEEAEQLRGISNGDKSSSGGTLNVYKITSAKGLNVRTGAGEKYKILGKLIYGDYIEVKSIGGGWANITYDGRSAYVKSDTLVLVGSVAGGSGSSSGSSGASYSADGTESGSGASGYKIGDAVICSGRPRGSSYGEGKPGMEVKDHHGKVTYLNTRAGVPYPVCVDALGWFSLEQVRKADGIQTSGGSGSSSSGVKKGVKISAVIILQNGRNDGKDEMLDCGTFEIDSISLQGPPSTLTFKGTSLSYSSTVRQVKKSKSWENTTLSGIARAIAGANGMSVLYESKSDPKYTRTEQYCMSDISFLQQLCHEAGCSLKATNNILVIFDQAEYEHKSPVRTIKFGEEGGYTKYKLSTGENSTYTSCRVYYTAPNGTVISATEYSLNYREDDDRGQCLEVRRNVSSIAEAQQLAHQLLRLHNKFENEATFTMPGDVRLVAGCTVELADFGMWSGIYIIKQATHTVSPSGYTTQIVLRKALSAEESGSAASSGNASDAELEKIADEVILGKWGCQPEREERLTAAGYDYKAVQAVVNKKIYG